MGKIDTVSVFLKSYISRSAPKLVSRMYKKADLRFDYAVPSRNSNVVHIPFYCLYRCLLPDHTVAVYGWLSSTCIYYEDLESTPEYMCRLLEARVYDAIDEFNAFVRRVESECVLHDKLENKDIPILGVDWTGRADHIDVLADPFDTWVREVRSDTRRDESVDGQ